MGSLPHPTKRIKIKASKEQNFVMTGNDRTSRLAIVSMLWNIFRHFSVYDGENEIKDGLLEKYLTKAAIDKDRNEFLGTLKMMTAELNDEQVRVWSEFEQTDYGLPFLWKYVNGKLVIYKVFGNNTYVKPGDIIISIEKKPTEKIINEMVSRNNGFSSGWKTMSALAELRAGIKNSKILLKIKNSSGIEKEQEFTRDMLMTETVEERLPAMAELKKGIFYIDMTRVNDEMIGKNLNNLLKGQGVIFDIRGFSSLSPAFLGLFLGQTSKAISWRLPIFTAPDHKLVSNKVFSKMIAPKGPEKKYNVAFIADERTYGNSEALLTLIRHYNIGKIIGDSTAGMSAEILGFRLPGDYYFAMTGMIGIGPDGKEINRKQIYPDIEVKQSLESLVKGFDDELERAVKYIETGK